MLDFQTYEIKEYFFADLKEMRTAMTAEQLPLVQSHVEKLAASLVDAGKMYRMPLVVELGDELYLCGGRNRVAALDSIGVVDNQLVPCLYTKAQDSYELVNLITGDNQSRRSNAAERKELKLAAKFGFNTDYSDIMDKVVQLPKGKERNELIKLAIAHAFCEQTGMSKNTALSLAVTMFTLLNKCKVAIDMPAKYDADGVQLTTRATSVTNIFDYYLLEDGTVIDNIIYTVTDWDTMVQLNHPTPETLKEWTDAGYEYEEVDEDTVKLTLPLNLQRQASKVVKLLWNICDCATVATYFTHS